MTEETKKDARSRGSALNVLLAFCGGRLDKPYCDGQHTFASDGTVIIRLPAMELDDQMEDFPDISNLKFEQDGLLMSLPKLPELEKGNCYSCEGQGKITPCHECDGDGTIYHSTAKHEYEWECEECNSGGCIPGGKLTCPECGGSGERIKNAQKNIFIDGHKLRLGYLKRISKLPGIKIVTQPVNYQHYFKFDGGDGILMGAR